MLNKLAKEIHENAKNKGFYDKKVEIPESLCLIHSEVSEALEAVRVSKFSKMKETDFYYTEKNKFESLAKESQKKTIDIFVDKCKNTFEDELADVIIRVLDLCGSRNIDIESHIKAKMMYNSTREYKHGKLF
jgi:NTP pyrophosphatase (non-canonical NTP hydrolase)